MVVLCLCVLKDLTPCVYDLHYCCDYFYACIFLILQPILGLTLSAQDLHEETSSLTAAPLAEHACQVCGNVHSSLRGCDSVSGMGPPSVFFFF